MTIREYLENNILLFDGSMGTYCAQEYPEHSGTLCEMLNLEAPEKIARIHHEYRNVGCMALKTNTFSANGYTIPNGSLRDVIEAGWEIANREADGAFVFADIGPIAAASPKRMTAAYREVVDIFLGLEANHFLFETNSQLNGILESAEYIKSKKPDAFIIVSFSSLPDGFTRSGYAISDLLTQAEANPYVDATGLNCVSGARHMLKLYQELGVREKPFSLMPNAGYPTVIGNRTFYEGDSRYFGQQIAQMADQGAKILGGCCGTTPAHIEAASNVLKFPRISPVYRSQKKKRGIPEDNPFWRGLCDPDRLPIAVELDSPEDANIQKYMMKAWELQNAGVDAITIADCPIARARMDAGILACKLHRELKIDVLPHLTCRDRNINAIKALLLGLSAEGVHNILTITGDPIPSAEFDEVKSVYNFNSRVLAGYIQSLGDQILPTPFHVFGALNVNARNFDMQLSLAKQKEEKGVCGFLTQPILSPRAIENLERARDVLHGKILGGIFPVVSYRNACFMNSEVSGIHVDESIIEQYRDLNREQGEELAVRLSTEIAKQIEPYVDGYYLMTPFGRTSLVAEIIRNIRSEQ